MIHGLITIPAFSRIRSPMKAAFPLTLIFVSEFVLTVTCVAGASVGRTTICSAMASTLTRVPTRLFDGCIAGGEAPGE
jgi:hypothetical protein